MTSPPLQLRKSWADSTGIGAKVLRTITVHVAQFRWRKSTVASLDRGCDPQRRRELQCYPREASSPPRPTIPNWGGQDHVDFRLLWVSKIWRKATKKLENPRHAWCALPHHAPSIPLLVETVEAQLSGSTSRLQQGPGWWHCPVLPAPRLIADCFDFCSSM